MLKYQQILTEIIKGKTEWVGLKTELSKYNIDDRIEGLKDTSAGKIFEVFTKYYFLTAPEHIGQYEIYYSNPPQRNTLQFNVNLKTMKVVS